MAIMRYDPWSVMGQLQDEVNRLFDNRLADNGESGNVVTSDWVPRVDIKEESDRYVLMADVPGVDPKDVDIHMEDGLLSIRGERGGIDAEERRQYKRLERVRGTFYRRFSLPDTADAERISANYRNGVLEVVIPKQEKVQRRKITVES